MTKQITSFKGDYSFLSNFAIIDLKINGRLWRTSEHMYMACKTTDIDLQEQIRKCKTPGKAKRLGRTIELREDWEKIKESSMLACLQIKFNRNILMKSNLLSTGNAELIEGNYWHDNYWGNCYCKKCVDISGKNILGKLLMEVRTELKNSLEEDCKKCLLS